MPRIVPSSSRRKRANWSVAVRKGTGQTTQRIAPVHQWEKAAILQLLLESAALPVGGYWNYCIENDIPVAPVYAQRCIIPNWWERFPSHAPSQEGDSVCMLNYR